MYDFFRKIKSFFRKICGKIGKKFAKFGYP